MNDTSRNLSVKEIIIYFAILIAFLMPVLTSLIGIEHPVVRWGAKIISITVIVLAGMGLLFKALWRPWQLFPLIAAGIIFVNVYPRTDGMVAKNLVMTIGIGCVLWSLVNIAKMPQDAARPTIGVYIVFVVLLIALFCPLLLSVFVK